jgi:hypothetical protein
MAATALTDRYATNFHGVLSCYDRIIVTGTLPGACYAGGVTSFLYLWAPPRKCWFLGGLKMHALGVPDRGSCLKKRP